MGAVLAVFPFAAVGHHAAQIAAHGDDQRFDIVIGGRLILQCVALQDDAVDTDQDLAGDGAADAFALAGDLVVVGKDQALYWRAASHSDPLVLSA